MDLPWYKIEKFVQELAWRDYWQQVWRAKGELIYTDLKNAQSEVTNFEIPTAILKAQTGIVAIDNAIEELYETGYMHNHMRMYVASICCNIAHCHWLSPAKWLYGNLLDGDNASNQLSWQWVAGAFSNKKYYANQDNINKYFNSTQKSTFLDVSYDKFADLEIPEILKETSPFSMETLLPSNDNFKIENASKTLIYNYFNLDYNWHSGENLQRILLLEPSFFKKNPVNNTCLTFALDLAHNIENIQVYVGEFHQLQSQITGEIIYKEHPTNTHYSGSKEARDWMSSIEGYHSSFFSFWKKCKREINTKDYATSKN